MKGYDEENRRKLSSSPKVVFREGPGSTVKSLHDNDIADKARNDLKDYYTRKQQELLRVIESECGIDSLIGVLE